MDINKITFILEIIIITMLFNFHIKTKYFEITYRGLLDILTDLLFKD